MADDPAAQESLRLDLWLWYARFFKARAAATRLVQSGKLRVNSEIVSKAHYKLKPGDVLTFPQGPFVRVVRVLALAARRGPAPEARELYEDLAPPEEQPRAARPVRDGIRPAGSGRPTKADRRAVERLKGR